jgi:MerR family copper efflux transcriptional regulator
VSRIPIACTLSAADQADRAEEWRQLKMEAITRELTRDGVVLEFEPEAAMASRLADLAMREVACCRFFTFTLCISAERLALAVAAPADAQEMLAAFVG